MGPAVVVMPFTVLLLIVLGVVMREEILLLLLLLPEFTATGRLLLMLFMSIENGIIDGCC